MEPVCGRKTMTGWKFESYHAVSKTRRYWVDQNIRSGFSIRCYRKIHMNFSANSVFWGPLQESRQEKE